MDYCKLLTACVDGVLTFLSVDYGKLTSTCFDNYLSVDYGKLLLTGLRQPGFAYLTVDYL